MDALEYYEQKLNHLNTHKNEILEFHKEIVKVPPHERKHLRIPEHKYELTRSEFKELMQSTFDSS